MKGDTLKKKNKKQKQKQKKQKQKQKQKQKNHTHTPTPYNIPYTFFLHGFDFSAFSSLFRDFAILEHHCYHIS